MKNFPHQVNDLGKLTAALAVAQTLIARQWAYNDDRVLGEALANAGVYTFRNKELTVAQNIAAESEKPAGNQGFRTAARDIRRFLNLAGLVSSAPEVTQIGKDVLAAAGHRFLRNALWREALLGLALADTDGNNSHPYRILLRLVADFPGIETAKLMLALEAKDDGPAEYARICNLALLTIPQIIQELEIGEANARNAVKILPAIAQQAGDLIRKGTQSFLAPQLGTTEDILQEDGNSSDYERSQPSLSAAVDPINIAPVPNFNVTAPNLIDLSTSIALRKRRTIEHQKTTVSIAMILGNAGYTTYANPYDCLGHKAKHGSLLVEVKTLDGSRADERRQSEKALGQLSGYRHFSIPHKLKMPRIVDVAAYSARPSADILGFMAASSIFCAWKDGDVWMSSDLNGNVNNFSPDEILA